MKVNYFSIIKQTTKNIYKYRNYDLDPLEYIILPNERLIYLVISKSACTSIKITLGKKYNIFSKSENGLDIHSNPNWIRKFRQINKEFKDYYKFTFVRNPFERLVSCYNDKVIYEEKNKEKKKYYFKDYPYLIKPNISFQEFIDIIIKIPDFLSDRHFRSQSSSIFSNKRININFIGKVENIKKDWENISKKFNFDSKIVHENKSLFNKKENYYFQYYNKIIAQKVYKRYKKDIKHFNYEKEYLQLLNFIKNI